MGDLRSHLWSCCEAIRQAVREAVRGPTREESLWSLSREDHHGRLSEPFAKPFVELLHCCSWNHSWNHRVAVLDSVIMKGSRSFALCCLLN